MPSTGFYPFLPILKQENGKTFIVSMPSTGFYPFLHQKNILWVEIISSVNALNGLLSISTRIRTNNRSECQSVSMPSTGFYPFLLLIFIIHKRRKRVSMPSTGFYPFLLLPPEVKQRMSERVNALNGLLSISTKIKSNF